MNIIRIKAISMKRVCSACIFILIVLLFVYSTSYSSQTLQERVDEYISAHVKMEKFSGSILIAQNGEILVSKGYGMADYEHDVPNTPQTKFRIGSITKQFTATAIMQLQEKGLLNVDDTGLFKIERIPRGLPII